LVLLPSRPLTHPWAERRTGRRRKPSLWHSSMAFRCSPPGHPPSTHPWAEPRTGCRRKPSLRHSSMVFPCTRQDPRSLCLRHSSCGPRRRGPVSGTPVPRWLPQLDGAATPTPVADWVADSGATNHTTPTPVTSSHPGFRRLPILHRCW
jgi:hypothetical protein